MMSDEAVLRLACDLDQVACIGHVLAPCIGERYPLSKFWILQRALTTLRAIVVQ